MNSTELLVNVTPSETRVALLESGVLRELHIERESKRETLTFYSALSDQV
ncbi:hypothetical protein [Mannheimia haemolytica]|nr:hypothetical protein [Mannheimia haemolytica]